MVNKKSKKKTQIKQIKDSKDNVKEKDAKLTEATEGEMKNERKMFEIKSFSKLNVLMKLRLVVTVIFLLSTCSILLVFVSDFFIAVVLILISYLMLFVLMIKLLFIKKL